MTISDSATPSTTTAVLPTDGLNAQPRALARARIAAKAITARIEALLRGVGTAQMDGKAQGRDVRRVSPFHAPPPSLAELHRYTKSGAWVPGDQSPWLERLGKAYGYVVSLPISAGLYGVAWLLQRPTRLALSIIVAGVVWLTH